LKTVETLSSSLEDYIEAIYHLVREKKVARAKDISTRLNVQNASVTNALHALSDRSLINYEPYEFITLTAEGKDVAKDIVRRHETLKDFFEKVLGIDKEIADEDACKMEHSISYVVMERLVKFIEFTKECPRAGSRWIERFGYFCEKFESFGQCERCISLTLQEVRQKKMDQDSDN